MSEDLSFGIGVFQGQGSVLIFCDGKGQPKDRVRQKPCRKFFHTEFGKGFISDDLSFGIVVFQG